MDERDDYRDLGQPKRLFSDRTLFIASAVILWVSILGLWLHLTFG